jgi:hypothetical protein
MGAGADTDNWRFNVRSPGFQSQATKNFTPKDLHGVEAIVSDKQHYYMMCLPMARTVECTVNAQKPSVQVVPLHHSPESKCRR